MAAVSNQFAGNKRDGKKLVCPYVPVAEDAVDVDDGALLVVGEGAALEVRPEVVDPPEAAALAAPLQPWSSVDSIGNKTARIDQDDVNKSNFFFELLGRTGWPEHTGVLGDGAPAAVAVGGDVLDELLVLLRRPQPALHLLLAAAVVPHGCRPLLPSPHLAVSSSLSTSSPPTVYVKPEAHGDRHAPFAGELTFMHLYVRDKETHKIKLCDLSKG
jgi:hypothetical protein